MRSSLGDTAFAALGISGDLGRGISGTQPLQSWGHSLWDLGDTAFEREGTFPHVFRAIESLQSSKTCNTAVELPQNLSVHIGAVLQTGCSLGDTAFGISGTGISGTQLFNERAHFRMYSSPQSRCKAQRHAIRRCDAAEFECSFTRRCCSLAAGGTRGPEIMAGRRVSGESLGDTAFDREGTFPHVHLAAESMQNSKTSNTAM